MKISATKRKTPDVPILPMVDLLSILLVFFIVTSEFKDSKKEESEQESAEKLGLVIDLPTTKEMKTTVVTTDFSKLVVSAEGVMQLDSVDVESMDELLLILKSYKIRNQKQKVELLADQKLPLQKLLNIWDTLTKAGFDIGETPTRLSIKK